MQDSCLNCYRKHISKANSFESEYHLGYSEHKWLAVGELSCAEDEVLQMYPALAMITREHRLKFIEEDKPIPTIMLIRLANELAEEEGKLSEENPEEDDK